MVKLWDLKKKDVVRTYKPTASIIKTSITSIQFNMSNELIGASNNKGHINIFPASDITKNPNSYPISAATVSEISVLKGSDASVNQFKFSPFSETTVASA